MPNRGKLAGSIKDLIQIYAGTRDDKLLAVIHTLIDVLTEPVPTFYPLPPTAPEPAPYIKSRDTITFPGLGETGDTTDGSVRFSGLDTHGTVYLSPAP